MSTVSSRSFEILDFYRGASALAVFLGHIYQIFLTPLFGRNVVFSAMGGADVIVFFVLSGLLIAASIEGIIRKHRFFKAKEYAVKRMMRLYPALLLSILLVLTVASIIHGLGLHGSQSYSPPQDAFAPVRASYSWSWPELLGTMMLAYSFAFGDYLTVNGPLWSLSYEAGFYILAGLIGALLYPEFRYWRRAAGMVLLLVLFVVVAIERRPLFFFFLLIWLMGVLLHYIVNHRSRKAIVRILLITTLVISIGAVIVLGPHIFGAFGMDMESLAGQFLWGLIAVTLIGLHLLKKWPIVRLLASSARFSYTLYLCHFPLLLLGFSLLHETLYESFLGYCVLVSAWSLVTVCFCYTAALIVENRSFWVGAWERIMHR